MCNFLYFLLKESSRRYTTLLFQRF